MQGGVNVQRDMPFLEGADNCAVVVVDMLGGKFGRVAENAADARVDVRYQGARPQELRERLGANPEHLIKCLKEAAAYNGPSIVIAYAPCINHGLSKGMSKSIDEGKAAVECGFWPLYHYNPDNEKEGKNPFSLDSAEPNGKLREYMMGENRFASLTRTFPERAEKLFAEAEEFTARRYAKYKRLAGN
mgnify:CR=1 FL=1